MILEVICLSFKQLLMSRNLSLSNCPNSRGKFSILDPEKVRILKFFNSPMIDRFSPKVHPSKQSILNFFRHLIDEGKQDKSIPVSTNTLSRTIDLKNSSGISKDSFLLSICKTSSLGQYIL
ncbi:hypothetical protein V8G54_019413 [Vigna mungo]|uniref:Uncharacterized protein n=1 Tax=Vigna mungo TaxID=3915 RepID=A0AAQ3NBJ4_VIGMU